MFGDKVLPKSKKARRRHGVWYWMAFAFVLCIGVLLGVNIALLVFASTSVVLLNLLTGFASGLWIAYVVSLGISALLGIAFLIGYMWTFAGASSTFEAAKAYAEEYATRWPWPQSLVIGLEVFFIVLDLISLSYRREFFQAKGAEQLFWFFVVLSLLSPVVGLLMHVLENKPLKFRLAEAGQHAANLVGDDIFSAIESMPPDRRTKVLFDRSGEELANYLQEQREEERQEREQTISREQERQQKRQGAGHPLSLGSLGQTGSQGNPTNRLNGRQ